MHSTDNPWNAWPSLHVVQSLLIVLVLRRWKIIYGIKEAFVWGAWVALCISILTTKQHFIFDLATGIAVALIAWFWLFIPALNATTNSKWIELLPSDSSDE
jgi:membrane-associated phospholipid phosphatase